MKKISVLLLLMLLGCSKPDYTLHFNENMILQYGTELNTIDLIEKIGDTKVTGEMKENNKLTYKNLVVECERVDTSVLTEYEVTYKTNDTENRLITKTVKIRDTTPPKITFNNLDNGVLMITKDEFSSYNFSRNITVKDNYDKNPSVEVKVDEIKGKDLYCVKVTATDKFNNTSTDQFDIVFKEKQVEKKEEVQKNPNSKKETGGSSSNESSNSGGTSTTKPSGNSSIKSQSFLFGNYYDLNGSSVLCSMDNVEKICSSKLSKSGRSGSCTPLKDANDIYIGMRLNLE